LFLLGSQKRIKEALPYLKTAARLQPNLPEPHEYLADAYTELGQQQNAAQESALAEKLKRSR